MAVILTKEEEAAEELRKQKEIDANKKVDSADHPISSDGDMQKFHEFVGEFKALNQRAEKERTEFGSALGETTAKLEQSGKRLDELEAMINKKFDEFEKRVNRKRIYAGDTAVGFVMLELRPEVPEYGVWRFMVDQRYQGMDIGRRALELVIEHVRALPGAKELLLSYVPGEGDPRSFYEKLGFRDTGQVEEGERVMRLELSSCPRGSLRQ